MLATNGVSSGHQPDLKQGGSAAGSASPGISSSMKERMSSLSASIKEAVIPVRHRENNKAIKDINTQLDNFRSSVKASKGSDLAEADFRSTRLPAEFNYNGLPEHLVTSIRKSVEELPEAEQTFGALEEILLQYKTEEKSLISVWGSKVVHRLVDLGRYDFNSTHRELTEKKKIHSFKDITAKVSKGSYFVALGNIMKTVFYNIAHRAVTWKGNPIDWLAKKAHKLGHDNSTGFIKNLFVTFPLALLAFGLKLTLKMGRGVTGLVSAAVTPFALLVGAIGCLFVKYVVVPIARKFGYYDKDVKEYCEYKLRQAEANQNFADMVIYAAGVSPFSKLNVTAEGVKMMENDSAYQVFKKEKKEAAEEEARLAAAKAAEGLGEVGYGLNETGLRNP